MHRKFLQYSNRTLNSLLAASIFIWLIFSTSRSQLDNTWKTLTSTLPQLISLLKLNDTDKLQALAPSYYGVIQAINAYPPDTKFYLIPCFQDSGNTGFWWWYLYLLSRYYSYPRKILSHNEFFYEGNKSVYLNRCINDAKRFSDIPWFKDHAIDQVILIRHNKVNILSPNTSTDKL